MHKSEVEEIVEKNYQGHAQAVLALVNQNIKNLEDLKTEIPKIIQDQIKITVNGKIDRLHQELRDYKDERAKKDDRQDSAIREISEKADEIISAVVWVKQTGNIVMGAGKIIGSVLVLTGAFWAFMKFVVLNVLK